MRPSDLKSPFSKCKKHLLIQDAIFYLPKRCPSFDFQFPGWADPTVFKREAPLKIEYCSGNGDWIAARALADPTSNWVAVEMIFDRVKKIWSKRQNFGINNLFIVCGKGESVTESYIPNESVSEVFINFPDPWPKRRHAKYRIIQAAFIKEIERILIPDATFTFVTDDLDYSNLFIQLMSQFPGFASIYPAPFFSTENLGYGGSFFDELWRKEGRNIRYHLFRKKV